MSESRRSEGGGRSAPPEGERRPLPDKALEQAQIFRNRLTKVARHLRRWPSRGVTCYRLYDHDIREVPLVVDRYEGKLHIAEYDEPHDRAPEEHRAWLDLMVRTAAEVLGVAEGDIFQKRRERQADFAQYEKAASEGRIFTVAEGGLKFLVNLSDYIDTGLFLDHRITRGMVRDAAAGKRFLNLFAYTGSFTVYAAAGGATSTTTVDLSNTYLEWARRNLSLNGLDRPEHCLVRSDAMEFLRSHAPGPSYDLAVVDPPTFSRSKAADLFDVQRHHPELLNRLIRLMSPGGAIFFSTNFRKFRLAEEAIRGAEIREISRQTVPPDFHDRKVHRCWRMLVRPPAAPPP
jgi:23S rRNA G2069 N7-methylase RlmK/C1962 C5-methylase RlmI